MNDLGFCVRTPLVTATLNSDLSGDKGSAYVLTNAYQLTATTATTTEKITTEHQRRIRGLRDALEIGNLPPHHRSRTVACDWWVYLYATFAHGSILPDKAIFL